MRRLLWLWVAGCGPLQAPVFEPDIVTASACGSSFARPGDVQQVFEPSPGIIEVHQLRDGQLIGWGRAQRLETAPTTVRVREVGVFTPSCSALGTPRTGHAATKVAGGRVYLSGGVGSAGVARSALSSSELFDPVADVATAGPPLAVAATALPRAFHSSTLLPNGMVLLHAGERYPNGSDVLVMSSTLVFDAASENYGAVPARATPLTLPRTRHLTLSTAGGVVVIAGGVGGRPLAPVLELERFDPADGTLTAGARAAAAVTGGAWVPSQSQAVLVEGAALERVTPSGMLAEPARLARARAAPHVFARGDDLMVAGEGTSEIVNLVTHVASAGPAVPAVVNCSVALDAERWLFVSDSAAATVVSWRGGTYSAQTFGALPLARTGSTCTLLDDGTVLVAGGEAASGVLADAFFFTPPLP